MDKKVYFGETTKQQRILLFETYEFTGNVTESCKKARVSRTVFYHWFPRFESEGYAGLEKPLSRAPHNPDKTPEAIEENVQSMKSAHPNWGKLRIAQELTKENNWEPVISPNTVQRIVKESDSVSTVTPSPKKKKKSGLYVTQKFLIKRIILTCV